jgi:hypothetical protein
MNTSSTNNQTFAAKNFEIDTEIDIVRLLLKNETFAAKYSYILSASYFRERLRPIVEVACHLWKHYGKLPSNAALVQELKFKIGTNFSQEKLNSTLGECLNKWAVLIAEP